MVKMDWSNQTTLEFLMLYQQEPVIWNPEEPLHQNRNEVTDAWNRIQSSMTIDTTVLELKRKKESLMSAFRHHQTRVNKGIISGNEYKPTWFAYQPMASFLKQFYQPQIKANAQEIQNPTEEEAEEYEDEEVDDTVMDNGGDEDGEEDEDDKSKIKANTVFIKRSPKTLPQTASRKRKIGNIQTRMETLHKMRKISACVCPKPMKDECSLYAELLGVKLRAFDEATRDVLMHEIDNLIYQAKLQNQTPTY